VKGQGVLAALFLLLAVLLMLFAPASAVEETLGDPGPALLPRLCGAGMLLLAFLLFFQSRGAAEEAPVATERRPVIIASTLAVPAFFLAFQWLGFTLSVALYLFFATSVLGQRSRAALLRYSLVAVAFSLLSSLLFGQLLDIPLPGLYP
jgi:hypothetical protein